MGDSQLALAVALAPHYRRFRVSERILLTGHSHQAWPDAGFEGQQQAWLDAAEYADDKWARAGVKADEVKAGFARLLDDEPENVALGVNTHELVTRWLSALDLRARPRIVTGDGEFHTLRRQLARLAEAGLDVVCVASHPVDSLADRLAEAIDDRTGGVAISSVLFETSEIVPGLGRVAEECGRRGASLLVDAYHHVNAVPFSLREQGLADAFVTGGGYKYCQLGEGNCFLRVPPGPGFRPVLTGWFAEFESLAGGADRGVAYGPGARAFAGATYDPTSHYRAAAVFAFHERQALTPERLRGVSLAQVSLLEERLLALDLPPRLFAPLPIAPGRRGGFLAVRSPAAAAIVTALRARGVFADARGDLLRLGPAPYVAEQQLRDAALAVGECVRQL